jgi:LacI family transcriptional regulator
MGAACVRMLDDRLHARVPRDVPLRVTVAGRIIERASSGPAPA